MACQHEDFVAEVDVNRIKPDEETEVAAFTADIKIRCAACGEAFGFRGMAQGFNYAGPTRDVAGTLASLPLLSPADLALMGPLPGLTEDPPPPPMPGFSIEVR